MNVQLEKESIIRRLENITDESLIMTVKNLLDNALGEDEADQLLRESLDRGVSQSKAGQVKPHKEVMSKLRTKYKQ